jgi:hypothetical protein
MLLTTYFVQAPFFVEALWRYGTRPYESGRVSLCNALRKTYESYLFAYFLLTSDKQRFDDVRSHFWIFF